SARQATEKRGNNLFVMRKRLGVHTKITRRPRRSVRRRLQFSPPAAMTNSLSVGRLRIDTQLHPARWTRAGTPQRAVPTWWRLNAKHSAINPAAWGHAAYSVVGRVGRILKVPRTADGPRPQHVSPLRRTGKTRSFCAWPSAANRDGSRSGGRCAVLRR